MFSSIYNRMRAVLLRAEFDANKDIPDIRKAKELLDEGERKLRDKMHYQPIRYESDAQIEMSDECQDGSCCHGDGASVHVLNGRTQSYCSVH